MSLSNESTIIRKLTVDYHIVSKYHASCHGIIGPLNTHQIKLISEARKTLTDRKKIIFNDDSIRSTCFEGYSEQKYLFLLCPGVQTFVDRTDLNSYSIFKLIIQFCSTKADLNFRSRVKPKTLDHLDRFEADLKELEEYHYNIKNKMEVINQLKNTLHGINNNLKTRGRGPNWGEEKWLFQELSAIPLLYKNNKSKLKTKEIALIMVAYGLWLPSSENYSLKDIIESQKDNIYNATKRRSKAIASVVNESIHPYIWEAHKIYRTQITKNS
ncbi:MAG TPA: hypothetical protein PKC21_08400 [Oligoflexia bacterium]|nr:hypothetical protein [Oligoflexia bacterium]HMR25360.1 hypothetical protein [Oligoflexia bacterium]